MKKFYNLTRYCYCVNIGGKILTSHSMKLITYYVHPHTWVLTWVATFNSTSNFIVMGLYDATYYVHTHTNELPSSIVSQISFCDGLLYISASPPPPAPPPFLWCSWRWLSQIWLQIKVKVKKFKPSSLLVAVYRNLIQNSADLKNLKFGKYKTQKFIVLPF
jgi:hypothetical protein